jgi:metal-dependent amidase/aminoacylase/carboxypeptidase family protein
MGTARAFTTGTQDMIESRLGELCCGVASMFGGKIDLAYQRGYPPTVNAYPEHVDAVKAAAAKIVGGDRTGAPQR